MRWTCCCIERRPSKLRNPQFPAVHSLTLQRVKSTVQCSVQQAPAISRSTFGRTLGVAGWVLAIAAAAEIIAAGVALTDRAQHLPPLVIKVPPINTVADSGPPPLPVHEASTPSFGDPFASQVTASPTIAPTPAAVHTQPLPTPAPPVPATTPAPAIATLPKPTPVEETQVAAPQSRVDGLLAEATALKQRGDMSTAITRLREALAVSPNNPQIIANLASTYEKMDLQDKALE